MKKRETMVNNNIRPRGQFIGYRTVDGICTDQTEVFKREGDPGGVKKLDLGYLCGTIRLT